MKFSCWLIASPALAAATFVAANPALAEGVPSTARELKNIAQQGSDLLLRSESSLTAAPTIAQNVSPAAPIAQATPAPSVGRSSQGFYLGISGGLQNRERSGENPTNFIFFNSGPLINFAGGYRFGDFRLEVEYTYWDNNTRVVAATATGPGPGSGAVSGNAYMFNVYYDIPLQGAPFKPYVGLGVGTYNTIIRNVSNPALATAPAEFGGPFIVNGKSENAFAFQFRAGVSFVISREFDAYFGYRYFNGDTLKFRNTVVGDLAPDGAKLHALEVGLRFNF